MSCFCRKDSPLCPIIDSWKVSIKPISIKILKHTCYGVSWNPGGITLHKKSVINRYISLTVALRQKLKKTDPNYFLIFDSGLFFENSKCVFWAFLAKILSFGPPQSPSVQRCQHKKGVFCVSTVHTWTLDNAHKQWIFGPKTAYLGIKGSILA